MIALLAGLGWGSKEIAEAIDWSREVILIDIRRQGGAEVLFPNRPSDPFTTYAATFKYYADHRADTEPTMKAIRRFLEVDRIVDFSDGMERSFIALCQPSCLSELVPYVNFVFSFLFQGKKGHVGEADFIYGDLKGWHDFLADVAENRCKAPRSRQQACEFLSARFATTCDRTKLLGQMPEGLRELIDGWLNEPEWLTPRQKLVITSLHGLDGKKETTKIEIAKELGTTFERVRQLEDGAVRKFRTPKRMGELRRFFRSIGEMTELIQNLEEEKAVLARENEEFLRQLAGKGDRESTDSIDPENSSGLGRKLEELELSVRTANCLQNAELETIGQVIQLSESELLRTKNFGRKSLNELKWALEPLGFFLGTKLPPASATKYKLPQCFRRE